jgi:hypothetical protein
MIGGSLLSLLFSMSLSLWAQTNPPDPPPVQKQSTIKTRKATVEKEAEGTKATSRFEKDPVIKSRYEYEGAPLEVDPD